MEQREPDASEDDTDPEQLVELLLQQSSEETATSSQSSVSLSGLFSLSQVLLDEKKILHFTERLQWYLNRLLTSVARSTNDEDNSRTQQQVIVLVFLV
jgi:hypothetical protein